MEYKHDFLRKTGITSRVDIVMGLFFVISSIYFVWDSRSNWGLVLLYITWGISIFFDGMGIPPARILGEKFILVNEEKIHFKFSLYKKGMLLHTKDIENIDLWPGSIIVYFKNEQKEKIDLRELDPQTRHDTLMAIGSVAEKRQIQYRRHGYLEHYN